ncbi:MAG: hypothetical protein LBT33_10705 [Spirochaetia bacterium]|jgi:hypothetical protein|nr:hypothetical protein [Spirochaetia bacterium]
MTYGTFIEAFGQFGRQLEFLSKAIGHDETRLAFHNIKIEPSDAVEGKYRAVASDGRRLHIVDPLSCPDNIGVEPGLWRFLRSTTKTAWIARVGEKGALDFPNYRRVIPDTQATFETEYWSGFETGKSCVAALGPLVKFINSFPSPTVINPAYLADLGCEVWKVSYRGNSEAVVFESGNLKAIIMPLEYIV